MFLVKNSGVQRQSILNSSNKFSNLDKQNLFIDYCEWLMTRKLNSIEKFLFNFIKKEVIFLKNIFKMNRHWFIKRTTNIIIINGFNKYCNKKGTETKLEHNQNGKSNELKELRLPTLEVLCRTAFGKRRKPKIVRNGYAKLYCFL